MTRKFTPIASACLLLLAGSAALLAPAAHAAPPGGGHGGPGGGPGRPQGKMVAGTITAINATAGTITITPTSGTASVVTLTTATVLAGHQTISASSIALGDTLDVSGIPLSLQVSSLADDHTSSSSSSGTTTTTTTTSTGTTTTTGPAFVPGTLQVRGVVSALTPPTITVDNSFSLTLSLSSGTTVSEIVTITASQIAVGDTAVAQVSSSSGTLTATRLDVAAPSS